MSREILIPIFTAILGVLGGVIGALFMLKGKRIDESGQIRQELWKEIGALREMSAQLSKDVANWRERFFEARDLKGQKEIEIERISDDLAEAVECIQKICQAGDSLEAGDFAHARELLRELNCQKFKPNSDVRS